MHLLLHSTPYEKDPLGLTGQAPPLSSQKRVLAWILVLLELPCRTLSPQEHPSFRIRNWEPPGAGKGSEMRSRVGTLLGSQHPSAQAQLESDAVSPPIHPQIRSAEPSRWGWAGGNLRPTQGSPFQREAQVAGTGTPKCI